MAVANIKEWLDKQKVNYKCINHYPTYTSQETAASAHVPGRRLAKTVILKVDGKLAMLVLPAHHNVNFDMLQKQTGAKKVSLATESEFKDQFPECEVGAMPPFGNLYGMDVYIEDCWGADRKIAFNAGTHTELVQLQYEDYENLVHPKTIHLE